MPEQQSDGDGVLIGVCGPVGVGKASVGVQLAAALDYRFYRERYEDNPFFTSFRRDRATWAFRSQLAFIVGALEDAADARQKPRGAVLERPAQEMYSVFVTSLKDDRLLSEDEKRTLEQVLELGRRLADPPDLWIVLSAEPDELLARIRRRARPGEETYTLGELERLGQAYKHWAGTLDPARVISRDTAAQDLRQPRAVAQLAREVRARLALLTGS